MALLPGEKKKIEWKTILLNYEFGSGGLRYFKIGQLVYMEFQDIHITSQFNHNDVLAENIPEPLANSIVCLMPYNSTYTSVLRLHISANEKTIINWYSPKEASNVAYYGKFIYLAKE